MPKAPGIPVVEERTATSITLAWDSGNPEPISYYIIQHKSKYSDELYKEIDGVATTRYSVGGLSPYSDYEFRVVAVNNIGRGPPSESIEAKTAEQAPSTAPRQVRGHMMSATTAFIQWDEPEEANGQITGYRVYYTMDPSQHPNHWEKQIVRGSNIATIQGLIPNKTYYIKILAYTSVGDGPLSPDLQIIAKTGGGFVFKSLRKKKTATDNEWKYKTGKRLLKSIVALNPAMKILSVKTFLASNLKWEGAIQMPRCLCLTKKSCEDYRNNSTAK